MGHSHAGHQHGHGHHHHAPTHFDRTFKLGIALNFAFVLIEVFFGWQGNSLSLLADAGHNLSD
ncbi:MAG: cation transporter, partial [Pseudomonas sp.]